VLEGEESMEPLSAKPCQAKPSSLGGDVSRVCSTTHPTRRRVIEGTRLHRSMSIVYHALPPETTHGPRPQEKPCVVPEVRLYLVRRYRATTARAAPPHTPEGIRL
jgi:hypothetical protein